MAKTGLITEGSIQTRGLAELRRALKSAGDDMPKELTKLNKQLVSEKIVPKARAMAVGLSQRTYGPGWAHVGRKGVDSIRALSSATQARLVAGGARAPWFAGNEFGSRGGPHKRQFPAVRRPGYMLWPTVIEEREAFLPVYASALEAFIGRALPR